MADLPVIYVVARPVLYITCAQQGLQLLAKHHQQLHWAAELMLYWWA